MGGTIDGFIHSEDVQNFGTCIKVLAGPGAGKTHWLIGQIKAILSEAKDLGRAFSAIFTTLRTHLSEQNLRIF